MNAYNFYRSMASNFMQATLHGVEYPTANGLTKDVTCGNVVFTVTVIDESHRTGFDVTVDPTLTSVVREVNGEDRMFINHEGVEMDITPALVAVLGTLPNTDDLKVNGNVADLMHAPVQPAVKSKLRRSLKYVGGAVALAALGVAYCAGAAMLNKR